MSPGSSDDVPRRRSDGVVDGGDGGRRVRRYSGGVALNTAPLRPCSRETCNATELIECACGEPYCSVDCFIVDWSERHMHTCPSSEDGFDEDIPVGVANGHEDDLNDGGGRSSPDCRGYGRSTRPEVRCGGGGDGPGVTRDGRGPAAGATPPRGPSGDARLSDGGSGGRNRTSPQATLRSPRGPSSPAANQSPGVEPGSPAPVIENLPDQARRATYIAEFYEVGETVVTRKSDRARGWNGITYGYLFNEGKRQLGLWTLFVKRGSADFEKECVPAMRSAVALGSRILLMDKLAELRRGTVKFIAQNGDLFVFLDDQGYVDVFSRDHGILVLGPDRIFPQTVLCFETPLKTGVSYKIRSRDGSGTVTLEEEGGERVVVTARPWHWNLAFPVAESQLPCLVSRVPLDDPFVGRLGIYREESGLVRVYTDEEFRASEGMWRDSGPMYRDMKRRRKPEEAAFIEEAEVGLCVDSRGKHCRCVVVKRDSRDGFLDVRLLDYGIREEIEVEKYVTLPHVFALIPPLGVTYKLDIPSGRQLTDAAARKLQSCADNFATLNVKIIPKKRGQEFVVDVANVETGVSLLELKPLGLSARPAVAEESSGYPVWPTDVKYCDLPVGETLEAEILEFHENSVPFDFCAFVKVDGVSGDQVAMDRDVDEAARALRGPHVPRPNELVLAKHDGLFYRAVGLADSKVWFLDYGNVSTVSPDDVRAMPKELLRIPCETFVFMLSGTTVRIERSKKLIRDKMLEAQTNESAKLCRVKVKDRLQDVEHVYEADIV